MTDFREELNRAKVAATSGISTTPPANHVSLHPQIDEAAFNTAVAFGRDLITTQDLDPVDSAIHGAGLPYDMRACCWLTAAPIIWDPV